MHVQACPSAPLPRAQLAARYRGNRLRSRRLFAIVKPEAYLDRPIPLRLPIVFYDGHIPAFSFNTLIRTALGRPSVDAHFERIFERGIDPADAGDAKPREAVDIWPKPERVRAFADAVDSAVLDAFARADLTDARSSPLLERAQAAYTILEHEEMHHETLLYMLHRLPLDRKRSEPGPARTSRSPIAPSGRRIEIPAGIATLGVAPEAVSFGWDNEFGETTADVAAFDIDEHSVTNADWLDFVREGGPVPPFWIARDDGAFDVLGQFELYAFPGDWPVYVTHDQASAYAAWRGGRLPTEAEYHRAAFGTPEGTERAFPWGDEEPHALHGNFDLRRYDPEPVGSSPAGASAWGVHDLIGNGWEWTSTPFAPLPGFAAMASYPAYSADFFDGEHYVIKGASPVTSRHQVRRSFRNWFRPDYPYVYAKFRLVRD
jgi:formylglycine-generating enzyme required for sulfatase activity